MKKTRHRGHYIDNVKGIRYSVVFTYQLDGLGKFINEKEVSRTKLN